MRALRELGCIELVDTAPRRGAVEHYYRALMRPLFSDRDWKRLPRSGRQAVSDTILQMIWEDVSDAMSNGVFEARSDRYLSRTALDLDTRGWAELNAFLQRVHAEAERIVAQSAERLADSGAVAIPSRLVMMHFEVPR